MALFAPHETDLILAQLDDRTLAAWSTYSDAVRDLDGAEYERAERDAWASLQVELRAIESERCDIVAVSAAA